MLFCTSQFCMFFLIVFAIDRSLRYDNSVRLVTSAIPSRPLIDAARVRHAAQRQMPATSPPVQPPGAITYEQETARCFQRVVKQFGEPGSKLKCMRGYVFEVTVSNGVPRLDEVLCGAAPLTCPGGTAGPSKP